jgi:glycosyltransferase involved in cell wall biosynthesis
MNRQKVIIVSTFSGPLDGTLSNRFVYLADTLSSIFDVELITTDFYHSDKSRLKTFFSFQNFDLKILTVPKYHGNISIMRMFSHFIFAVKVFKYLILKNQKNTLVYCAFPPIFLAALCYLATKNKNKFILDVQDLWPEVFYASKSVNKLKFLFWPHRLLVKFLACKVQNLVSVSETYLSHFKLIGFKGRNTNVTYIGVHLEDNYDFEKISNPTTEIVFVYAGTLGHSYNLNSFLIAFAKAEKSIELQNKIKLLVIGSGPIMKELQNISSLLKINIQFTGRIPHNEVLKYLKCSDVAINSVGPNMKQSIINKHGDYLVSGLPILSTQDNEEFKSLVNENGCGINVNPNSEEDLINAIVLLANSTELRNNFSKNALKLGQDSFLRKNGYQKLVELLIKLQ